MVDLIGQQVGVYRLKEKLGEGGFSEVYLAENIHIENMLVAIKILKDTLPEKARTQFVKEAGTVIQLRHPHIIKLLYFDFYNGLPYLVMDYIQEGSLRKRYPEGSKLALSTIVGYVKQIADALQHAHERGIIHRDIKPDNILWEDDHTLLVSDFGIATASYTQGYSQQEKIGTLPYMSPEHFRAKAQSASDQYSLAIVVYEWLCGIPPFTEGDFIQMGYQHAIDPPPPLHDRIAISPEVEQVVLKALAKEPKERFEHIATFASALENAYTSSDLYTENIETLEPLQSSHYNIINDNDVDFTLPPDNSLPQHEEVAIVPSPLLPSSTDYLENEDAELIEDDLLDENEDEFLPIVAHEPDEKPEDNDIGSTPTAPLRQNIEKEHSVEAPYQTGDAGIVGRGVSGATVVPPLTGIGGNAGSSRPKRSGRQLLSLALITGLLLSLLLCGGIALAAQGTLRTAFGSLQIFGSNVKGGISTSTVTITPKSALLSNTYVITGISTGTPNPSHRQVQARQLTITTQAQSKTVSATGRKMTQGIYATGTISFYNSSTSTFYVAANNVFTDAQGRQIANDALVAIPAGNPSTGTYGYVTASAHAVTIGASGNIPAGDITNTPCCGDAATGVSTNSAFTGGQDPQNYTVVQQSDVDAVANSLQQPEQQSAQTALNRLKHANEQFVNNKPQCANNITSNPNVGAKATNVTVSVTATCTSEVFDLVGAETIAANLLKAEADKDAGANYALSGSVLSSITSVTASSTSPLTVLAKALGVWVYQFDATAKTNLAKLIVGKAQNDAMTLLLQQAGVGKVDGINIGSGGSTLSMDFNQITIVVQPVVGLQGTPTVGKGSPTPGTTVTPTTVQPTITVTVQGS